MKMLELVLKSRCVLGLYSRDNVLVELFAKDRQKQELLEQEGIRPGCIWNEIGYNAVEEGQAYFRPCSSVGEVHQLPVLKNMQSTMLL